MALLVRHAAAAAYFLRKYDAFGFFDAISSSRELECFLLNWFENDSRFLKKRCRYLHRKLIATTMRIGILSLGFKGLI